MSGDKTKALIAVARALGMTDEQLQDFTAEARVEGRRQAVNEYVGMIVDRVTSDGAIPVRSANACYGLEAVVQAIRRGVVDYDPETDMIKEVS